MVSWKKILVGSTSGLAVLIAAHSAAAQVREFNVPAQPISQGLVEFARQAGVSISAPTGHLGRHQAPEITGRMEVDGALRKLLEGTDLYVASRDGSVIILRQTVAGPDKPVATLDDVAVVGSRIAGSRMNGALPVTVISEDQIDAIGAVDGDELFRAIPQMGDVSFNETMVDDGGINSARGDVASLDLRGVGTGNTLALLNGRRLVAHPGTQVENLVPVTTVNTNSIPIINVRRVEVLTDGAAALYGTDAVAGVVNTVLRDNFEGFVYEAGAGRDEGGLEEYSLSLWAGRDWNDGRTNVSLMFNYLTRDPLYVWERDYATVPGRLAGFDGRADGLDYGTYSTITAWAEATRLNPTTYKSAGATTRINGQNLTATDGAFHIQPSTNEGCIASGFITGTCFDNSNLSTASTDDNLRYDTDAMRTMSSALDRANLFTFVNHEFENGVEFFGEAGYYWARTWSQRPFEAPTSSQRVLMSPTAYWNPFGAVGVTARLPGLVTGAGATPLPTEGAALEIRDYRYPDMGFRDNEVENDSLRLLGGLRGQVAAWDWESALLYSRASVNDVTDAISMTGLQTALNMTTPDAYNPFVGGDLTNFAAGRLGLNSQKTIDGIVVQVGRYAETELMLWDLKASTPSLYELPAGSLGFASGLEVRRETIMEDRDDRLDGTITFTDLAGVLNISDVAGTSYTPDSSGARDVYSAYAELAVPVVSPEMNIPLVQSIDLQLAGRIENYSQFGFVAAPKIALAYRTNDWLMFRTAWSQGFRAPNLMQLHQSDFERVNSRRDYSACAVQLAIGAITSITGNNEYCLSEPQIDRRAGNAELKPEHSDNFTFGVVIEPELWPRRYGDLTLTVDYWRIEQTDLVGVFGGLNHVFMDYYLRQIGETNPAVVRSDPTAQQIADATAAGLAPVGDIIAIEDIYLNLQPRFSAGIDYRLEYRLSDTPWGRFNWSLNVAQQTELYQTASPQHQVLLDALESGAISGVTISGVQDLIRQNGRPEWRASSTLTWSKGPWQSGLYSSFVSDFDDTSAQYVGTTDPWIVDAWTTHNLYLQYTFESGAAADTRVRLGVRNIGDKDPPLSDDRFGYNGSVHSNRGRWWYATIRQSF